MSFFNFQSWNEIEIQKIVLFLFNFKIKIEWHFRCTDFGARIKIRGSKRNLCMESIIQKINFKKNENCIFSFLNFWNVNVNVIFRFFEIRILISIWVSIKIETKFEFIEFDCDVKEVLSGW